MTVMRGVRAAVTQWRKENANASILNPSTWASLKQKVLSIGIAVDEGEAVTVAAICACCPKDEKPLPHADRLTALMLRYIPADQVSPRANEFAVAYGSGAWPPNGPKLPTGWPGGFSEIAWAVKRAIGDSDEWLQQRVVDFPPRNRWAQEADASVLALRLQNPTTPVSLAPSDNIEIDAAAEESMVWLPSRHEPKYLLPGAKFVFSVKTANAVLGIYPAPPLDEEGDPDPLAMEEVEPEQTYKVAVGATMVVASRDACTEIDWTDAPKTVTLQQGQAAKLTAPTALSVGIWECTCGTARCAERHRMESWDPTHGLTSFVASAVKGPNNPIRTNSFVAGMYCSLLTEDDFDA